MAVTIAAVGGLALGAAKFISGLSAQKSAQKSQANLKRPFLKVQDEYYQNQNIAKELATSGLPIDVTNQLARERAKGLTTSLDALKQTAGGPNAFASLNKSFDDSLLNQSSLNAQQQLKNIEYFMNVNKEVAGQKTTQFGVNELQPYENNLKQLNERIATSEQNKWEGISEGIGSLSAIGTGNSNSGLLSKLFGSGRGDVSAPYGTPVSLGPGGNPVDIQPATAGNSNVDVASNAPALNPLTLDVN